MAIKVETPPILKGDEVQKIASLYAYLFRLSENLNVALNNLTVDSFTVAEQSRLLNASASNSGNNDSAQNNLANSYRELRELIVNTAEIIRSEMDVLRTELNNSYEAISDEWGIYQENITNSIEATAEGILQSYGYDAKIETLQEEAAGFSQYIINTGGYIRQGFIDYDENNIPIIGIAIGQGLTSTRVELADGTVYEQIDRNQNCAFYTANKLSFRINGQEVAYLSNRKLYIYDVEINGTIILRGEWMIDPSDGLEIDWIGDDE